MKYTLSLQERIIIPTLWSKGSFTQLLIRDEVEDKIRITQKEVTTYQVLNDTASNTVSWNDLGNSAEFQYEFTEAQEREIAEALRALDRARELQKFHKSLYKKFVK